MSNYPSENWYGQMHEPIVLSIEATVSIVLCNKSGSKFPRVGFWLCRKTLY